MLAIHRELQELTAEFDAVYELRQTLRHMERTTPPSRSRDRSLALTPEIKAKIEAGEIKLTKGQAALKAKYEQEMQYLRLREHFRHRHNQFNKILADYNTFRPAMAYEFERDEWRCCILPSDVQREFQIKVRDQNGITVRIRESDVVLALARLAADHQLSSVRLCAQCQKVWRVARREMDRFCTDKCRDAHRRSTPKYRECKKKIQRDYRARERRRDKRAKRLSATTTKRRRRP